MSIEYIAHESVHNHPFTIVDNELINSDLAPETCFMLIYMCSKPPKWKFHDHMLMERLKCGKDKLQRMRKEAREAGYMKLQTIPSGASDGKFNGTYYLFSCRPIFKSTESGLFRLSANPTPGKQGSEVSNTERHNNTERLISSTDSELEKELIEVGYTEASAKMLIQCHGVDKMREGVRATHKESVVNPRGFLNTWLASRRGVTVGAANEQHVLNLEHRRLEEALRKSEQLLCGAV